MGLGRSSQPVPDTLEEEACCLYGFAHPRLEVLDEVPVSTRDTPGDQKIGFPPHIKWNEGHEKPVLMLEMYHREGLWSLKKKLPELKCTC